MFHFFLRRERWKCRRGQCMTRRRGVAKWWTQTMKAWVELCWSVNFLRHSRAGVSENSDFANYVRLPVVFDLPSGYRYHSDLSAQNAWVRVKIPPEQTLCWKSYHTALGWRTKVSRSNLHYLSHVQRATTDAIHDKLLWQNGYSANDHRRNQTFLIS